jgi:hypothetical protein
LQLLAVNRSASSGRSSVSSRAREVVVGGVQKLLDGLHPDLFAELVLQPAGGGAECELLVDG